MLAETSKYLEGTDNAYSITEDGRIYSHSRINARGSLMKGRWLKPYVNSRGYFVLCNRTGGEYVIHRLVAKMFIPNPEDKPFVNHIDGNKTNNHASNLEWCTASENIQHAYDIGIKPKLFGERNGKCKVSFTQVQEIISLRTSGSRSADIAETYGISSSQVNRICRGASRQQDATSSNLNN